MSALILFGVMAIWVALGWLVWKVFVQKRLQGIAARSALAAAFVVAWGIAPWVDEMLGALQFERACAAMQPVKFTGPVSIGTGPFFDEAGRPKWRTGDEFWSIKRESKLFEKLFEDTDEIDLIARWPMPIQQRRSRYVFRPTGALLVESTSLTSPGGWLKRASGWGVQAPYQCPYKGPFPRNEDWIRF